MPAGFGILSNSGTERVFAKGNATVDKAIRRQRLPKMLFYVADDNIEFAEYCTQVARREGWTVEVAQNGSDLLDKLRQGKEPALILCDIQMPKLDGIEVEQKLPKINRKLRVRFKARTEYATDRLLLDGFVFPNGKIEPLMDSDP
ncbi:response regulator [Primorskyibacter sp. 2E233]|uniref:response regulator n=1 Tax=Primorskyibacter sp. 2E233 TaxID=3413431 RepID=UPI003BF2F4A4